MNIRVNKSDRTRARSKDAIAVAVATILAGAGSSALAAAAPAADDLDEIVVTGIRHSIEASVTVKKNDDGIVEAVSAEDIGKLPDQSIADSIARLPGLTGQRVAGRTQDINIRGMSGDFSTTLLNGREQASTGDNRAVEFDQYPSELINSVVVYKTGDATRISQGLSGTVELRSVRPLDFEGKQLVVNLRGDRNSLGALNSNTKDTGYRFSASYIDHFLDNTLGVAVGYARLDSPGQEQHYKAWWWSDAGGTNMTPFVGHENAVILNGTEAEAFSRKQVRDGLMGVIEYRPNEALHTTADLYYSKYAQRETMRGLMESLSGWDGVNITNPGFATFGGTEFVNSGTYNNVHEIVRNDFNTIDDKLYAIGINNELSLDHWKLVADLSYSKADRAEQVLESYAGAAPIRTADTVTLTNVLNAIPSLRTGINYGNAALLTLGDPAGWGHDGTTRYPRSVDDIKAIKFSAERPLGAVFASVNFGISYQQRTKSKDVPEYNLNLLNGRAPVSVASDLLQSPTSLNFANGLGGVMAYDIMPTIARYYSLDPILDTNHFNKGWSVDEKLTGGFVKLGIDTMWGPIPVKGGLGVQLVHAQQSSTGLGYTQLPSGTVVATPDTFGTSYNDVLPNLNLVFDFSHDYFLRTSIGRTMVRPRMEDMRANISAGVGGTPAVWSGSGGNPLLKPWRADNYDLSLEKYFSKGSYASIAGFYKNLKSYIYQGVADDSFNFAGFPSNGTNPINGSTIGSLSRPANGQGGKMRGLEFSLSLEGRLLWSALDGFGTQLTASTVSSTITPDPALGGGVSLPGLSPHTRTMTFYYEKHGFSARISERYRAAYLGEVTALFATRSYSQILADRQTDLQLGYAFESGPAKGLSILAQVNNLNNSPYRDTSGGTFTNGVQVPQTYELYGRQYLFGVNYKFN